MKKVSFERDCLQIHLTGPQISKQALERNADLRAQFRCRIARMYTPEQLVFVDESACDRRTTYRGHAWAMKGTAAVRKAFFVRGRR